MATNFELVDRDELRSLVDEAPDPAVSIYMPTHRLGPETELDTVRLKNLVNEAFERLTARGLRRPQVEEILEPATALLGDGTFWRHQLDGLALFLAPGFSRHYRLPFEVDELVVVDDVFQVTPLLPALGAEGHFFILAVSRNALRLLRATRYGVEELDTDHLDIPKDLAEALRYDDFERRDGNLQHRGGHGGPNRGRQIFHGHGQGAEDVKNEVLRYFQAVDRGLSDVLRNESAPLVLASVDYLQPLFRQASRYAHVLEEGVDGNPDRVSAAELHERALPVVEAELRKDLEAAKERYGNGQSNGTSSCDLADILVAAHEGRVDALFVRRGARTSGRYDAEARRLVSVGDDEGTDLIDLAARQTLLHAGEVYVVDDPDMPCPDQLGAVFRY
ncbi:MAG TPA: hypothetical protein VM573_05670 [Actinomycetota bacterium]|jgi:hypothetical protein|nr:hypothetical protein [Actinomycetota bacterium]